MAATASSPPTSGTDKLKRFEFEINIAALEPAMIAMMVGGTIINDGIYDVGVAWPSALECGDVEPVVALEFWTDHWNGDAQDPDYPYIHHVYPQTRWQIGQQQYQNDFAQPVLTGFSGRTSPGAMARTVTAPARTSATAAGSTPMSLRPRRSARRRRSFRRASF